MQSTHKPPDLPLSPRQIPPQAVEVEETILGGILLDPEALSRVLDILRPEMFYLGGHGLIYRAMVQLHTENLPPDLIQVLERLRALNQLEQVGGQNKLFSLIETTVSAVNIDLYAKLVEQKFYRRQLLTVSTQIAELAHTESLELEVVCDRAEQLVMGVTNQSSRKQAVMLADSIMRVYDQIEQRSNTGIAPGLKCGFYDLDAMTSGFQRGDLVIVAGRPSMGKTAFVLSVLEGVSRLNCSEDSSLSLPVALFSLETEEEMLTTRLLSRAAHISSGALRSGRVRDWDGLNQAVVYLSPVRLLLDDTSDITVNEIRSRCRMLKAQYGDLGMIAVDYLQLMGGGNGNRVQELSNITRSLKHLARELNCCVVVLSQLSRGVESRDNKRPMNSDLRDSGAIEQDADLILMLYRDEYYNPDTPDRGIAEVIATKHRNGPTGTVKLLYQGEYTEFMNLKR